MSKFHVDATSGVQRPATNPIGLVLLQRQLRAANNFVDAAPADLREEISSQQREANRGFTPVIQQAMQHAYDMCVIEHGKLKDSTGDMFRDIASAHCPTTQDVRSSNRMIRHQLITNLQAWAHTFE